MLIQAAADFHGDSEKFQLFRKGVAEHSPDLIVMAGDILDGSERSAQVFLDLVTDVSALVYFVPGNADPPFLDTMMESSPAVNMYGKKIVVHDLVFAGVGDPRCQNMWSDTETRDVPLDSLRIDVLLSHIPPRGHMDKTMCGFHIGNKVVRHIVDEKKPRLVLCGHVHENPGYIQVNGTAILNCSIGKQGLYSLVDIGDSLEITMVGYSHLGKTV